MTSQRHPPSILRRFLDAEASGGLMLMAVAALALLVANSPWADRYFAILHAPAGPLSVTHWINDGFMAIFFLLVGLEIKREVLAGQLSTWSRRALPGVAALGGMIVPALIFLAFNHADPAARRGWAISSATDIAFALGVISLLGRRVPASLKIFLTALAIMDDLGAVAIIAAFYTGHLSLLDLALAGGLLAILVAMNRLGVRRLLPYLALGGVLWVFTYRSGIHATVAGVALGLVIPLGAPDHHAASPLHRLEHALNRWVAFLIVPVFGFANAGVSFAHATTALFSDRLTLGVALGLLLGKLVGVGGSAWIAIRLGLARLPRGASWTQMVGVALLCGIGFTMSLFIGLLAFDDPALQSEVKIGILGGSLAAGLAGWIVLRLAGRGHDPAIPAKP